MYQEKPKLVHHNFFCMNTNCDLFIQQEFIEVVENRFYTIEQIFSRFKLESEVSFFNSIKPNIPYFPSESFYQMLDIAKKIEKWSEGIITPRVLESLELLGYNKSFEKLNKNFNKVEEPSPISLKEDWIQFNHSMKSITRLNNVAIDLGGFVKGWSVDTTVQQLKKLGLEEGMINAGGDLKIWGNNSWTVEIADPLDESKHIWLIKAKNTAIATSGTIKRSFGNNYHHIINPFTGMPANSDIIQTTVVADSVLKAEILSKIWIILGYEKGLSWMKEKNIHLPVFIVLKNGEKIEINRRENKQWQTVS